MGVVISPNLKRTKEMIDTLGNVIDPETKQIKELNTPDYIPTKEEIEAQINTTSLPAIPDKPSVDTSNISITQRIENAKKLLADLKEEKKAEIERKRKELAELEKDV